MKVSWCVNHVNKTCCKCGGKILYYSIGDEEKVHNLCQKCYFEEYPDTNKKGRKYP